MASEMMALSLVAAFLRPYFDDLHEAQAEYERLRILSEGLSVKGAGIPLPAPRSGSSSVSCGGKRCSENKDRDLLSTMVLREGDMSIAGPAILRARAALRAAPTPTIEPCDRTIRYFDGDLKDCALQKGHEGRRDPNPPDAPPAPTAEQGKALGKDEGAARADGVLRNIEPVMCRTISALATAAALLDDNDTDDECIESAREVEQMQKAMVAAHGQVLAAIETSPAAARADAVREARDADWLAAIESWRKCSSKRLSWASGGHCSACSPLQSLMSRALAASPEGTPTETAEQLPKGDKP